LGLFEDPTFLKVWWHAATLFINFYINRIQGGSDISGPLSKPHSLIKKSYISLIISLKPSQIFVEAETKTNRHFPTNINQQEATRAVIVFGLRAG
jgi:hypothetical protein